MLHHAERPVHGHPGAYVAHAALQRGVLPGDLPRDSTSSSQLVSRKLPRHHAVYVLARSERERDRDRDSGIGQIVLCFLTIPWRFTWDFPLRYETLLI